MDWKLVAVFLSLHPLLGQTCSCFKFSNRFETLRDGVCGGEVYSGVVVSATCTCLSETVIDNRYECRTYSYSASNESYSAEVTTKFECIYNNSGSDFLKTCMQAENDLAPGVILQTGSGPDVVKDGTLPSGGCKVFACPFNDDASSKYIFGEVCVYMVRITEVFIGDYSVGDEVTSSGPDTLTSCSTDYGGILQLNAEYLVGVGSPCSSAFNPWELLSAYTERDLDYLRKLAHQQGDQTDKCSSKKTAGVTVSTIAVVVISWLLQT